MLGITKKSIELSKKVNGEIAKWPAWELQKYSHSKSAREAARQGEELFYNNGCNNNVGITKKSIKLSRKVNGEIAKWPASKLQKYSHSKSARKAAEEGKNLFYQM